MAFWDKFMTDDLVYWAPAATDARGNETFPEPVDFKGAYLEKTELFTRKDGKETMSRSLIETSYVINEDGYIWEGKVEDLSSKQIEDPRELTNAYRVMRVDKSKMLNKSGVLIKGYL